MLKVFLLAGALINATEVSIADANLSFEPKSYCSSVKPECLTADETFTATARPNTPSEAIGSCKGFKEPVENLTITEAASKKFVPTGIQLNGNNIDATACTVTAYLTANDADCAKDSAKIDLKLPVQVSPNIVTLGADLKAAGSKKKLFVDYSNCAGTTTAYILYSYSHTKGQPDNVSANMALGAVATTAVVAGMLF